MAVLFQVKKHISNKRGSSAVIFVLSVTLFLSLLSISVDAGLMYVEKSKLQNTVDAAALAGMAQYSAGADEIMEEANEYAVLNGVAPESLSINISEDDKKISVSASKNVTLYFARIFGRSEAEVSVKASAIAAPIVAVESIRPLAIEQQTFEEGQTYTLKRGGGSGTNGNYGALALGGTGSANYRYNLKYGFNGHIGLGDMVEIGDEVDTEPGNMAGPTLDGISYILSQDHYDHDDLNSLEINCQRLITVPIVDSLSVPGRKTVKIVGFAQFFLEDVIDDGGHTDIKGKFLRKLGEGKVDPAGQDFGYYGIKLVE